MTMGMREMRGVVLLCCAWGLLGSGAARAGDAEAIEEVLVTGSYLKRTAADSPSPLAVVSSADIQDLGAVDVSEIVDTLPWQSGSQTRATTFGGEGADGRNSANLRNLGHGATLVLVNGRRQVASWYNPRGEASVNVNGLIPNIAIERIEIVKDGSSALYGSDAIAGVMNFITKKNFEGFDVNYQVGTDEETGNGDSNDVNLMLGMQGDRGGVVVSGSFLERGEITIEDRYDRFGGTTVSATGQPGSIVPRGAIVWAAHGLNPGQPVVGPAGSGNYPRNPQGTSWGRADVDCERSSALERTGPIGVLPDNAALVAGPQPPRFSGGQTCVYDYASFFSLQSEESLRKFHVTGHYDVTDAFEAYVEFAGNDSDFRRKNSLNPNSPTLTVPVTNFGVIEDAFRRGIVPIPVGNGTRMLGGTVRTDKADRPLSTFTRAGYSDQRMVVGGVWTTELLDRQWTVDFSYTRTEHDEAVTQAQDTLSTHMELALNGFGGPNCNPFTGVAGEGNLAFAASGGDFSAGRCYFFNPFGSHRFARDGSRQTNLTLTNPDELYQWLQGRASSDATYRERVFDVVAAGDLFDLFDRPVGLAVGFQHRRDTGDVALDSSLTADNLDFVYGADDWDGELSTTAFFAEVNVPIGDTLEVNIAGRYEEFDEIGEDTTDPKITVLWRPLDSLSLRASAGSSFRVASMQQLFGSLTTVANQTDVLSGTAFLPSITEGNDQLVPETADTYNVGVSWSPEGFLDGFQIDLDYYNIDYQDVITRESTNVIIAADNAALAAAVASGAFPTLQAAALGGAGNTRQMIRTAQGTLVRILPDFVNAASADIDGFDLNASYTFDTSFGLWRIGAQGAWAKTYDVEFRGAETDAVGQYNQNNVVARPLPEFKWNGSLAWSLDQHRAFLLVQYVDDVNFGRLGGTEAFFRETVRMALGDGAANDVFTKDIESMTTVDLQYTYSFGELAMLSDSSVSLGVQNLTDEEPPWVPVVNSFSPILHDPRGRVWFMRISASM
jgi:iron complex outermembrane receptor protein